MVSRIRTFACWIACITCVANILAAAGDIRLLEAVKTRDKAAVRLLLNGHPDVNAPEGDGSTALAWAAHWDDLETAELLIEAGANVNAADDLGVTPLWHACKNGNSAMVEKLLKAGANPRTGTQTGETALMTCTRGGNLDAVQLLLARGSNVNAAEAQRGQTALMWAASRKHPEIARVLVEHGADANARSKQGSTPLHFAARVGDLDSARVLAGAGANLNVSDTAGMTPLLIASASGQEEVAIFLVESGANPNIADPNGLTALHFALQKGLSLLRDTSVYSTEARDWVMRPNMERLVKSLLVHGANPNLRIADEPIMAGNLFASLDQTMLGGASPFLLATATGDLPVMRLLLANGANPLSTTTSGATALMVAASGGGVRTGDLIEFKRTPEQDRNLFEAAKLMLKLGVDVNAKDQWGQTALHFAAFQGIEPIIRLLVENGAGLDVKDQFGMTPLSIAEGIVPSGMTLARRSPSKRKENAAKLLRQLGASVTISAADSQGAP